jgi:hypothetical protein
MRDTVGPLRRLSKVGFVRTVGDEASGDVVRYGPNRLLVNTEVGLKGLYCFAMLQ